MQGEPTMRLTALDGLRGMFMVFMVTTHFAVLYPAELQYLKFHYFGYVEDAQGFVFLSGVTVGIAYGRRLIRDGVASMFRSVLRRCRKIYLYQAVLVISVTLLALAFWDGTTRDGMFAAFVEHPIAYPMTSLGLLTAAPFINILPLYIILMAVTPVILWSLSRGHGLQVVTVSVLFWFLAQTGLPGLFLDSVGIVLAAYDIDVLVGTNFSVFAWQVLYVAGLVLGYKSVEGQLDLSHFTSKKCARLLPIVLGAAFLFAVLDIAENLGFADFLAGSLAGSGRRYQLPIIFVASFVIEAYLLAWLLLAGSESRFATIRAASHGLNGFFRLPFLILIGQHSIWVYAYHVLFLYCWVLFADVGEPGFVQRNLIFLLVGASTYPVARLGAWLKARAQTKEVARSVSRGSNTCAESTI